MAFKRNSGKFGVVVNRKDIGCQMDALVSTLISFWCNMDSEIERNDKTSLRFSLPFVSLWLSETPFLGLQSGKDDRLLVILHGFHETHTSTWNIIRDAQGSLLWDAGEVKIEGWYVFVTSTDFMCCIMIKRGSSLVTQTVKTQPGMWETRFNPWVGKIPWRREWLPTPVFLTGEFYGQRSLAGYSLWGHKVLDMIEWPSLSSD